MKAIICRRVALPLSTCALVAAVSMLTTGAAHASISGFNNGTGWTSTGSPPPGPTFTATTVTLTNTGIGNYAGSAFFNTQQVVGVGFQAQFTYQQTATADPSGPGDGIAFVVQNSPAGPSALGDPGGRIGYESLPGIDNSLAVVLDLNQGAPRRNTTGLGTNGDYNDGNGFATAPVLLESGHMIQVTLNYNAAAGELSETLLDLATSDSFSHTYTGINLSALLGGNNAYVGFTGGTGNNTNTQVVSGFSLTAADVPEPASAAVLGLGVLCAGLPRRRARRIFA